MRPQILLTIASALVLAIYAYTFQKYRYAGGVFEDLHASDLFNLSVVALTLVTGIVVRRPWVLLALIGPLISLGYLQATGYVSEWNDGNAPLLSPLGIFFFIWFGLVLLIGLALGYAWDRRHLVLRGARPDQDTSGQR